MNFPDLSAEAWTQFCWAGQTGICGTGFWGGQSYPQEELQTCAEGPRELSEGSDLTQRKGFNGENVEVKKGNYLTGYSLAQSAV